MPATKKTKDSIRVVDDGDFACIHEFPQLNKERVQFDGVRPNNPKLFQIGLDLHRYQDAGSIEIAAVLSHRDDPDLPERSIVFDRCLPQNVIPEFLISSTCFDAEIGLESDEVYLASVAKVLSECEKTSIVVSLTGKKVSALLTIGAFKTTGEIDDTEVSEYLNF